MIEDKVKDWEKIKLEYDKVKQESDKDLRNLYLHNFWAGIKMYNEKHGEKFDYFTKPK